MASEGPPFAVDPEVTSLLETLWKAGHGAYLVGGGVRDALLGLRISDWDVATDARPDRILRIFPGSSYQNRFGTVLARGLEVTTFRRDHRYADHCRPDSITFSDDIYEDLARRDLTINAIAWGRRGPDTAARLLDPADGRFDLEAGLVRAVGDPARRFDEDALRLLRAVRIAARLDFAIEPVTRDAMVAHAADVDYVSEERVGSELRRMLAADEPSRAIWLMRDTGILATTLPELDELAQPASSSAAPQPATFEHLMAALDAATAAAPGNERVAFAALLRTLGSAGAQRVLARIRVAGRDIDAICELIAAVPEAYRGNWSDASVRRYMGRVRDESLEDLLLLRHSWAVGDSEAERQEAELAARVSAQRDAASPLTLAELALDGRDLRETLGVPESPAIGMILERLLSDVIEEPSLNTRMTLLTRASLILDELVHEGRGGAEVPPIG
jgi:tRNA nucleotidyltransferase (CCA-adding enzyme)